MRKKESSKEPSILVREAKIVRVCWDQEWGKVKPSANTMGKCRRELRFPHYVQNTRQRPVFYELEFLEGLWHVKFDMRRLKDQYYVEINGSDKGFKYVRGRELSDIVEYFASDH